jgi:hypothetical protein
LWKPVTKATWWDNEITYDAGIQGPRGHSGAYSFCATARNTLGEARGKANYVGSLLADSSKPGTLSAAFDGAWGELALKPQNDARTGGDRFRSNACLAREERTAYTVTPAFGAVSALYRLAEYGREPIAVAGRQMWLLTPDRIVGRVEVECLEEQNGYGLGVAVRMICGRGGREPGKTWSRHGNVYQYGDFTVKLWPAGGTEDLVGSMNRVAGYMGVFGDDSDKSGLLVLHDSSTKPGSETPTIYKKGERYFAVVEIYPTARGGAQAVTVTRGTDGLVSLQVQEKTQRLMMLHNTGDVACEWERPAELAEASLHQEGEVCRLSFLPPIAGPTATRAGERVALKAGEHAVLRLA